MSNGININDINIALLRLNSRERLVHNGLTCFLVISGQLKLNTNGQEYKLSKDGFAVININQVYDMDFEDDSLILTLYLDKHILENNFPEYMDLEFHCISRTSDKLDTKYKEINHLKRTLTRLKYIQLEKNFAYKIDFQILFLEFMYSLITNFSTNKKSSNNTLKTNNSKNLSNTLKYINDNYQKDIRLDKLASMNYLTPNHFSKVFKKEIGVNLTDYIQNIRIEESIKDLVFTDKTMTQIGLDNGFNTYSSFYNTFIKITDISPSDYRKKYRKNTDLSYNKNYPKNDILSFYKYINEYEEPIEKNLIENKDYKIDLNQLKTKKIKQQERILLIDNLEDVLTKSFIDYINTNNVFNFKYIFFSFKINYPILYNNDNLEFYDFNMIESLDTIYENNLVPFFSIDTNINSHSNLDIDEFIKTQLEPILKIIYNRFPKEFTSQFKFEISNKNLESIDNYKYFYKNIYNSINKIFSQSQIGMFSISNDSKEEYNNFKSLLEFSYINNIFPEFLTIHISENDLFPNRATNMEYFDTKGYFSHMLSKAKSLTKEYISKDIPIYMTSWQIVSGVNIQELLSYFRSALIIEALIESIDYTAGYGISLTTSIVHSEQSNDISLPLALYFYGIKKSLYYILKSFNYIRDNILFMDNHILITSDSENVYTILIWNPIPLNPSYSIDNALTKSLSKTISIKINGIANNEYDILKTTYSKSNSYLSAFRTSGIPHWYDKNITEFMRNYNGEDVFVYSQLVQDNTLELSANLEFNSVVMFIIEK